MNDHQLYTLIKTVECGSFSKAEEILFLSKQALKKQIDSLEKEIGFQLIVRNHQGVALTPAGEEFCKDARHILSEIEATVRRCKGIAYNEHIIRIDNPSHPRLLLEQAFNEFSRQFPTVHLCILLQSTDMLADDIMNDRADLAECTYHEQLDIPGIAFTRLFSMPFKCIISSSHSLAGKDRITAQDLVGQRVYITQNPSSASLMAELTEQAPNLSFQYLSRNDTRDIINICYNGGVFISKAHYADFLSPLITVPLNTRYIPQAAMMYRENPSPIVKEFIQIAQNIYTDEKGAKTGSP